jgi:hypothetical protein
VGEDGQLVNDAAVAANAPEGQSCNFVYPDRLLSFLLVALSSSSSVHMEGI